MSQQVPEALPTLTKKQVRKQIFEKLTGALSDYKQELGEKKLATHVKKASKLISRDLVKISKKNHEGHKSKKSAAAKTAKARRTKTKVKGKAKAKETAKTKE